MIIDLYNWHSSTEGLRYPTGDVSDSHTNVHIWAYS